MGKVWNHGFKPGDHIPISDLHGLEPCRLTHEWRAG
jgi:hypothetical protein